MYELPGKAMAVIQDQNQLLISVLGLKTSVYFDAFFTLEGARRRFKTRIGLLAQPNFTPLISGAKVLADSSISASAA